MRFLISKDDGVESIIKHYIVQHPEYPIIVPITFNQLAEQRAPNPLLNAIRRNYLLRDLFGYQNPLREETFFFGRQLVVNTVLDMAKSGQNSSLFGLRKSGKTSTIYAIQRKAKGFGCNVALIDCQNPAVHARHYEALLGHVVSEIRRVIGLKKSTIELGNSPPEVSDNFFSQMNNIIGASKNTILLIFDEIENISPNTAASAHWRSGDDTLLFWQIIRSYIQSSANGRLSLCIVGTSPHILELTKINGVANPVYLFAQKQFIPNLTFDETREMVNRLGYFMGLEFPVEVVAELQKEFGGHPFFIRQVCSKIHQLASTTRPLVVSRQALQRATSAFQGQLDNYLRDIIEQLRDSYPSEYNLLTDVVEGNKAELTEYGTEAPELIDHLIGYGLVEKIGDDFDIKFEGIKTALRRLISHEKKEDRWSEISRRRNVIETNLRVALYHWSKTVDSASWLTVLEKNLTKKRYSDLASTEPNFLFSNASSPLYLSDLLALLRDERVIPYVQEQRTVILSYLDTINKLRKDAHALDVNDTEIDAARKAFEFLEVQFCNP